MLKGAMTALVTPMHPDGSIDFASLDHLVEFQITNNITGLVIAGSTGEGYTLNDNERLNLIERIIQKVNKRSKIIITVAGPSTTYCCDLVTNFNQVQGVDYIMATTPSYLKPTQDGLYEHFKSIAKISMKPIILYNVPSRAGCDLHDTTTLKLAHDFLNIIGLKDATGNIARLNNLVKYRPQHFALYSGDDTTSMAFMLCGGDGSISVVSNAIPNEYATLCDLAINGNKIDAIKMNNHILELTANMGIEPYPIAIKWILNKIGVISTPNLRLPLTTLSIQSQQKLTPILEQIINRKLN